MKDLWSTGKNNVVKNGFNLDNDDINDNYYAYTPADMVTEAQYPLLIVSHPP